MSGYGISPHMKFEGNGKVWIKKSVRPVETYSANEYNRKPDPRNYHPTVARQQWRQERAPFKAAMAEEIKGQQAAAVLKTMRDEKAAVETLANMKNGTGGRRRSSSRHRSIRKRRVHRRRRVTCRRA